MCVPGVSRGLHYDQPGPRSSPMAAGKSLQASHALPFQAPITLKYDEPVEGDWGWERWTAKTTTTKTGQFDSHGCDEATMIHASDTC